MKQKLNILTLCYLLFLILLFLSGMTAGILSDVIYFLAFVLPFVFVIYRTKGEKGEKALTVSMTKDDVCFTIPLVAPTVSAIIIVSALTSLLIFATTGKTNEVDVGDNLFFALISHALLPAFLEEMLFRYLPLRLLANHSKRATVLASAFFFALIHHNLFSIPYAFLAGVIFMAVDLAVGSVIPSFIIHFVNNALSVGLLVCADNPAFAPAIYIILGVLTAVSLCVVFVKRKVYLKRFASVFQKGEEVKITVEMLIFAGLTLSIALLSFV